MLECFDKAPSAHTTVLVEMHQAHGKTPHYHAKKLDFENALAAALDMDGKNSLATTDSRHFAMAAKPAVSPDIYENPDVAVNNDGNTVDLEKEMSSLAENSILYKSAPCHITLSMPNICGLCGSSSVSQRAWCLRWIAVHCLVSMPVVSHSQSRKKWLGNQCSSSARCAE